MTHGKLIYKVGFEAYYDLFEAYYDLFEAYMTFLSNVRIFLGHLETLALWINFRGIFGQSFHTILL
jgi:hypothetical protein